MLMLMRMLLAVEPTLLVARPSAVSRPSDLPITHTPKGVTGLPAREQNWQSQAGAACQCISTKAPLNKLAIAGHLWAMTHRFPQGLTEHESKALSSDI